MENKKIKKIKKMLIPVIICFHYIPFYSITLIFLFVLNGLVPVFQVWATTNFLDKSISLVSLSFTIKTVFLDICIISLCVAYTWFAGVGQRLIMEHAHLKLKKTFVVAIVKKCASLNYQIIESSEANNLIMRLLRQPEQRLFRSFSILLSVCATLISAIGVLETIAVKVWWAALIIIICCVPLFFLSSRSGKEKYDTERTTAHYTRKASYISSILSGREAIRERELFGYCQKLNNEYGNTYDLAFTAKCATMKKWLLKTKLGGCITALAGIIIVVTLSVPLLEGRITLGFYITVISAILSMTQQLSWGISNDIDAIVQNIEFSNDIATLFSLSEDPSALVEAESGLIIESIEFKNVSFSYPDSNNKVLNSLSFRLDGKKTYALVGANGAGKTTIIKLLTGLYKNYSGEILINDVDIRRYPASKLKGAVAIMNQNILKHELSIYDLCSLGNGELPRSSQSTNKVITALDVVDLHDCIEELPNGLDTMLGKLQNNGVDLSEGQWQRLTMARALLRTDAIKILDEPTASLDPKHESEFYSLFGKQVENELALFISHRIASTRIADEIIVLDKGRIVEQGDFMMLLNNRGLFADMFELQQEWYCDKG